MVGWLIGLLLLIVTPLFAQVYTRRLPTGTADITQFGALGADAAIPRSTLQAANTDPLLVEDQQRDKLGLPARLGVDVTASVDLIPAAVKSTKSGYQVAVYQFDVPNALGLSVVFDEFQLVEGARLFVYSADRTLLIGPITYRQNGHTFWTDLLEGSSAIIEVQEPTAVAGQSRVHVSKLVQYYRFAPRFGFGTSESCEKNTICYPAYQNEADGVVMLLTSYSPYTYACTGSMINSTQQDFRSFMLTAFHCYDFSEDGVQSPAELAAAANTQFRFHWESPTCVTTADNVYLTLTGANFRSAYANSDFTLMELTQQVPPSENTTYLGWDRSSTLPSSPFGIHHPSADIKKISFSPNATTLVNVTPGLNYIINAGTTHLQVTWAGTTNFPGVTEGGSSGSPLFDSNRRVVGQLHGGGSDCSALTSPDQYGRFFTSWTGGATASTRLSDWLDSGNIPAMTINSVKSLVTGPATLATSGSFSVNTGNSAVTSWSITGGNGVVSTTTGTGNVANLTALTNGTNLTITFGVSAGQTYPIQFTKIFNVTVPANTAPTLANAVGPQSATVGMAYTLALANVFTDAETPDQLTLAVSGLPAGLNFTPPSTISGTPSTTAGSPFSVTVTATDPGSLSAGTTFAFTVSSSAVIATAPVVPNLPNQVATVGTLFSYVVPAFTGTQPIVYTASGLPNGLSFDASTRTIAGTPTTVQTPTVTISASNVAGQSSGTFTVAVSASATQPTGPATLTITSFNCFSINGALSRVNFVVGYSDGTFTPALPDLFINGITITGQLGTQYDLNFDQNQFELPIADQATRSVYFVWNYRDACTSAPISPPVATAPVVPMLPNQTATVGMPFSYVVPAFTGTQPIVYTASGLPNGLSFDASTRTVAGTPTMVQTPTVTISASNVVGMSSGTFTIAVSASATQPTGPATLTITSFTCFSTNSALTSVNFVVGYSDGTFTPALPDLFINGITITGQLGQQYSLGFDQNQFELPIADQDTRQVYFVWNYRQACSTSPSPVRLSTELMAPLHVKILNNPVGDIVEVDVTGAEGEPVTLFLSDPQGRIVGQQRIDRAGASERVRFPVSQQSVGILLLRVATSTQYQAVRLLKAQ